jgi:hypothetical protein
MQSAHELRGNSSSRITGPVLTVLVLAAAAAVWPGGASPSREAQLNCTARGTHYAGATSSECDTGAVRWTARRAG